MLWAPQFKFHSLQLYQGGGRYFIIQILGKQNQTYLYAPFLQFMWSDP